jgi:hypothetical protein
VNSKKACYLCCKSKVWCKPEDMDLLLKKSKKLQASKKAKQSARRKGDKELSSAGLRRLDKGKAKGECSITPDETCRQQPALLPLLLLLLLLLLPLQLPLSLPLPLPLPISGGSQFA